MKNPRKTAPILLVFATILVLAIAEWITGWSSSLVRFMARELAAIMLILCLVPLLLRITGAAEQNGSLKDLNEKLFKPYHWVFGIVGFTLAIFHGIREGRCEIFKQLTMVLYSFFIVTGIGIQWKLIPKGASSTR